ncbi:hypothetical protein CMK12_15425 [Candidatus Poribacteria bacterium]|jgi:hypothetical protein|nr:hypothetical protein [Candidatus Poribacteria bacterium]
MNFNSQKSHLARIEIGTAKHQTLHKRKNDILRFPDTTYKITVGLEIISPKIEGVIHTFLADYPVLVSISAYSFCNRL